MTHNLFKRLLMIVSSAFFFIATQATPVTKTPDFAFPKTVAAEADPAIERALKQGDEKAALRALINYSLAISAISTDDISDVITRIKDVRQQLKTDDCRALADMLLAQVYSEIYSHDKYKFDRRELPLTPLPADYTEWSGDQFRHTITGLCNSALSYAPQLQKAPLKDYTDLITADRMTFIFYPTLYDFVAGKTIEIYNDFIGYDQNFPLILLSPREAFIFNPRYVINAPEATEVLNIYAELLRFHASDTAPLIMTEVDRLEFIEGKVYSMLSDQAEKSTLELLEKLYSEYASSEYSAIALVAMDSCNPDKARYYAQVKDYISRYPNYWDINSVINIKNRLEAQSANVGCPRVVAPGGKLKLTVNTTNATEVVIDIYRVSDSYKSDNGRFIGKKTDPALTFVTTTKVTFDKAVPFTDKAETEVTIPDYGRYIAISRIPSQKSSEQRESHEFIYCTELAAGSIALDRASVYCVNPFTGKPQSDVEIKLYSNSWRNKSLLSKSTTDAEGFAQPTDKDHFVAYPSRGKDLFGLSVESYIYDSQEENSRHFANGYTDLPLYHPGDTVKFVGIIYSVDGRKRSLSQGVEVTVQCRNANYVVINSLTATTDKFGRVTGCFEIPKGELTGNYTLDFGAGDKESTVGEVNFMVSDYKLPTYQIILDTPAVGVPSERCVTLRGKLATYSGVPMGATPVNIILRSGPWSVWGIRSLEDFYSVADTTDAKGNFEVVIDRKIIDSAPFPYGQFQAAVSATAANGESRAADQTFMMGKAYAITSTLDGQLDISSPASLGLTVTDSEGKQLTTPLDIRICNYTDNATVWTSSITDPSAKIDFSKLRSGRYDIVVTAPKLDCDSLQISNIVLYRPTEKYSPVDFPIWSPATNVVTTDSEGRYTVLYAVPEDDSSVLLVVSEDNKMVTRHWLTASKGFNKIDLKLSDGSSRASVIMMSMRNGEADEISLTLRRPEPESELKIVTESFRDRLIPGGEETWTISTVDGTGKPVASAVMLDMVNASLLSLHPSGWSSMGFYNYFPPSVRSWQPRAGYLTDYLRSRTVRLNEVAVEVPQFETYGRSFIDYMVYNRGMVMYKAAAPMRSMANAEMTDESVEEEVSADFAAALEGSVAGVALHETVTVSTTTPGAGPKEEETPGISYRQSEVPLGLYRPILDTDASGKLTLTFRVPDANTTWVLNALAYTERLSSGSLKAEFVASKPVMVQPNLPRFIRQGDEVTVSARVINNSDSIQKVTATVELFDPATGRVIRSVDTPLTIAPDAMPTVDISVTAGDDTPFIGYRIRAKAGRFTDGEQALIAVRPSAAPVIETQPFYIAPDSLDFTMAIAPAGKDARVTLQYCDNPTWYVLTALPGLAAEEPSTPGEAASAIYSACVARGLIKDNPAIADALRQWTSSDRSDSTLVSMLERNQDLKIMLLQATPWMLDARSDTERMERLSLMFDSKQIESTISTSVKLLDKLRRSGGGWAWINQYDEPSQWATSQALYTLGRLNSLGYMPDNKKLRSMVTDALSWHQKEVEKDFRRYPKASFLDYVVIRDLWPDVKPSAAGQSIISNQVQRIVKDWKSYSIAMKATVAPVLFRHGYKKLASTVLGSMREYAKSSPEKGTWWPSVDDRYSGTMAQLGVAADALEAFSIIEPKSKEIDGIRQWLILQKEARNWGSGPVATRVAHAVLATSPAWVQKAQPVEVTVGSSKVETNYTDDILGYFRTDITSLSPSGSELRIVRSGDTPAWGAVYTRSIRVMSETEASKCDAVSIEKRLYLQQGSEWTEADRLTVGDRVKIQLLIHVTEAMDYVAVTDDRAACLEPVEQLPKPIFAENLYFYRENRDTSTNIFISHLPKGTYLLEYEMWVNNAGQFSSGVATIQSQYAPELSAHSAGSRLTVNP